MCQKLLHLVKAFKRYEQKYALVLLYLTTRYIRRHGDTITAGVRGYTMYFNSYVQDTFYARYKGTSKKYLRYKDILVKGIFRIQDKGLCVFKIVFRRYFF